jgi:hypothetical protein
MFKHTNNINQDIFENWNLGKCRDLAKDVI